MQVDSVMAKRKNNDDKTPESLPKQHRGSGKGSQADAKSAGSAAASSAVATKPDKTEATKSMKHIVKQIGQLTLSVAREV